jgi:hypothetical protein
MRIGAQLSQLFALAKRPAFGELGRGGPSALSGARQIAGGGSNDDLALSFDRIRAAVAGSRQSARPGGRTDVAAAEAARLEIQGGEGGVATASAGLVVESSRGRLVVNIAEGESLADVAQRINRRSRATRISAAVSGANLVLLSTDTGRKAKLRAYELAGGAPQVGGLNPAEVSSLQVLSPGASLKRVEGEIISTAQQAELRYIGESGGLVAANATFLLHGRLGTTTVQITAGESLAAVAARINAHSSSTAVTAAAVGDDLLVRSTATGSGATVEVELIAAEQEITTTGVNPTQVALLEVTAIDVGSEEVLSGSVQRTASLAELTLAGTAGGLVADGATFELQGTLGARTISITAGESLAAVAARVNALTDVTGVVAEASGDHLVFRSTGLGSAATVAAELQTIDYHLTASGENSQQVTGFEVLDFTDGATHVLAGSLTRAATQAELTLHGGPGAVVVDGATFELRGSLGAANVSIVDGESLAEVATRVNALAGTTGVTATVSGNNLVFRSAGVGSAATAAIDLQVVEHHVTVSGVNSQQVTGFQATSVVNGATQTLSGSITQAAGMAQLTFTGFLGVVNRNSTFTLTGSTGSASFTTTTFQTLSNLAAQINAATGTTGVQATVQGDVLTLRSTDVGSAALVQVNVTSGNFPVAGGNGSGQAFGTNAVATINGQTVTAAGNQFSFSDAVGSYFFNAVQGYTGALSTITVQSQAGQFDVDGGDGEGAAAGLDAQATINGSALTASGNQFSFTDALGNYAFTAVQGFTGSLSPITVQSQAGEFELSGGNGDGTAAGLDALAVVNGAELTGTGNQFTVVGASGQYELQFQAGFTGSFDPVTVRSEIIGFDFEGGDGAGQAAGADAVAVINGTQVVGSQNRFTITGGGGSFVIEFADGFTGEFEPITIGSTGGALQSTSGELGKLVRGRDTQVTYVGNRSAANPPAAPAVAAPEVRKDFTLAQLMSRRLNRVTPTESSALVAMLRPNGRNSVARAQWLAALLS